MKSSYLFFLFLIFLLSCSGSDMGSGNNPSDGDSQEMDNDEMDEAALLMGEFVEDAHPTTGKALINEMHTILSLIEFKSDDGPILELYLATDLTALEYISLGELKGLEGNYTYDLPSNVDFQTYRYLIVWCVDFSVSFGHAVLE